MKIRPKIQKFEGGKNLWYERYIGKDYDPSLYKYDFDTSQLVDGDMSNNIFTPWVSNIAGYDKGRYTPTSGHGSFGKEGSHFKYTLGVEQSPYYKKFGQYLIDEITGNFTPLGETWAKAVDALLPPNHPAKFFDENKKLKTSWVVHTKDSHNRPPKTYTSLKDYVNYIRNDLILGARHNVFLNKGKRYFYKDEDGNEHWVDPKQLDGMNVSAKPVRSSWNGDHTIFWEDYELTGKPSTESPAEKSNDSMIKGLPFPEAKEIPLQKPIKLDLDPKDLKPLNFGDEIPTGTSEKKNFWTNLKAAGKLLNNPNLYATVRLAGQLINNNRIYDEALKGIRPELMLSYHTHRQVVGDEATKLAYYRRAAQGLTKAAQPFTSDADRQMAYQYEAKRIGDELKALGDLADNQEIRRTSDESNQHQWANTQRDTEVANVNMKSLVLTNALKHNLLAQKHAAQWASIDNYLLGLENLKRQRNAENTAINDSIYQLTRAGEIENDPTLLDIKERIDAASKKPENLKDSYGTKVINWDSKEMRELLIEKRERERQLQIETLYGLLQRRDSNLWFLKSGAKITHKRKDDLLYKTARDNAEHFRKMSKMSSDALNRKKPKIERLAPHPKGRTRKYLLGGLAPFGVYRPAALGGETTTSSQTSTSGTSDRVSSGKDTLKNDLLKELFKALLLEGIPSDVNAIFSSILSLMDRKKAFGEELSSDDITSLYLQSLLLINTIKFNKSLFDTAQKIITDKDAISEFAVDLAGRIAVQTDNHEIKYKKPSEIDLKKDNPLRNGDLLNLRAFSNAFDNSMILVAANATSMKEISEFLKALLPKIESNEIEGYTKKDANLIKLGIQVLKDAPEGDYKFSEKSNKELAELALSYLYKILPNNMKALLEINSGGKAKNLIAELIGTLRSDTFKLDAVTGKAAKDANGKDSDVKSNPLMQMVLEEGGIPRTYEIITRDSNAKMSVSGTYYSLIPKVTEDTSIDKMLSESGFTGILDSKLGITFGDLNISPELLKDIMYSNTGGMIVTLPCKIVNGHKEINLEIKNTYEKAILEVEEQGISRNSSEFSKVLGEKLKEKGLNSLLDANGYPDKNKFAQFLVVEAYTTSKISNLDKSSQYIEKVKNPSEELEKRMIEALSTDSKKSNYSLDIDYWLFGDDVYRGSVFIPLTNNLNAAINAWGDLIKVDESLELETRFQQFNKASAAKPTTSNILQ